MLASTSIPSVWNGLRRAPCLARPVSAGSLIRRQAPTRGFRLRHLGDAGCSPAGRWGPRQSPQRLVETEPAQTALPLATPSA